MNRKELETELISLGTESMHCEKRCEGARSSIEEGMYPRYVMISGSGENISCIIVSLTPAKITSKDRKLLDTAKSYKDMPAQYRGKIESTVFYAKLDAIRNKLGLEGSVVWTTLCKCERVKGEALPYKTMQTCAESHLAKEFELIDKSIPIIAVGNRVFSVTRDSFPERFVLNIPSPDGPRGDFQKTAENRRLLEFAKARIAEGKPGALCLCPPCALRHLSTARQRN